MRTSAAYDTSWTCAAVATCAAGLTFAILPAARSPMDGVAMAAAVLFLLGTWGGGLIGIACAIVTMMSRGKCAAKALLPLLANVAAIAGFTMLVKLCDIGPSFSGGPAGF